MSKQLQKARERGMHAPSALALFTGDKNKAVEKAAKRAAYIDARDLEENRRELQKHLFELQEAFRRMRFLSNIGKAIPENADLPMLVEFFETTFRVKPPEEIEDVDKMLEAIGVKAHDEREKIAAYFQFLSTYLIAAGVVHLSDYLCVQFPKESTYTDKKTGEKKTRNEIIRFTIGDIGSLLVDLTEGWSDPNPREAEPGLFGRIDQIHEMLNDLGNKHEAWVDENGIHDPSKYFAKTPSNKVQAETEISEDEEDQEEIEESKISDDELEAAKRGEIDIPDMRGKEKQ